MIVDVRCPRCGYRATYVPECSMGEDCGLKLVPPGVLQTEPTDRRVVDGDMIIVGPPS